MALEKPTFLEAWLLSKIRYESELHNHAIVHSDASVLPDNRARPLNTRSNHIEQYGARPDNYEITYIMHNQQPWANRSDKPCLVTYNPVSRIDESKIVKRWWFQHIVHDVRHIAFAIHVFRLIQGKRRTWHCGAHTLVNSQEHGFVSGLVTARQLGADYPFDDDEARKWFKLLWAHDVRMAVAQGLTPQAFMERISIATGEAACGASLSALGPVMLPNERLLNELNVPKGKPRMRPLIQCPDIVPCTSASRRAEFGAAGVKIPVRRRCRRKSGAARRKCRARGRAARTNSARVRTLRNREGELACAAWRRSS